MLTKQAMHAASAGFAGRMNRNYKGSKPGKQEFFCNVPFWALISLVTSQALYPAVLNTACGSANKTSGAGSPVCDRYDEAEMPLWNS